MHTFNFLDGALLIKQATEPSAIFYDYVKCLYDKTTKSAKSSLVPPQHFLPPATVSPGVYTPGSQSMHSAGNCSYAVTNQTGSEESILREREAGLCVRKTNPLDRQSRAGRGREEEEE